MRFSYLHHSRRFMLTAFVSVFAIQAFAEDTAAETALSPEITSASAQYQACVNEQFSSMESAASKRESLSVECSAYRDDLLNLYPPELQGWVQEVIGSRVSAVLFSLEQVEGLVIETVADVEEIVEELASLEAEAEAE